MNIFDGSSSFGMRSKRLGRTKRDFLSRRGNPNEELLPAESCSATESERGELVRRTQKSEEPSWTRRGLFKSGFNIGSPRLRSARKFTK